MNAIIGLAAMAVPVITNMLAVNYTRDLLVIAIIDGLVLFIVSMIVGCVVTGDKGYAPLDGGAKDSDRGFMGNGLMSLLSCLGVLAACVAFFIGMHSKWGQYTCGAYQFLLPEFPKWYWAVLYFIALLCVLGSIAWKETYFYSMAYSTSSIWNLLMVAASGILCGGRALFLIEAMYSTCGANLVWLYGLWLGLNIFIQFSGLYGGHASYLRDIVYFCAIVAVFLLYFKNDFVTHKVYLSDPKDILHKLFAK